MALERRVLVSLVGAGPGDADLLTIRAARLIGEADVIVHDALVGDGVLSLAREGAELIDVGKRPGRSTSQASINRRLIELATAGLRVVRLKGGDPFVFGRGGEEAEALATAGVPFDIVPGVTSSVAAPAAAGIPVTHRGVAATFTVITGHRRDGEAEPEWSALARLVAAGGTLVVLMGVSQRRSIATRLIEHGCEPSLPAVAVHDATLPTQTVIRSTLHAIGDEVVASPAVLVIGATAGFDLLGP